MGAPRIEVDEGSDIDSTGADRCPSRLVGMRDTGSSRRGRSRIVAMSHRGRKSDCRRALRGRQDGHHRPPTDGETTYEGQFGLLTRPEKRLLIASAKTQSKPLLYPSRQPDPNLV